MKYPPMAPWPSAPSDVPDGEEMRTAAKQRILDMLRAGDLDERQARDLIAELGLRDA